MSTAPSLIETLPAWEDRPFQPPGFCGRCRRSGPEVGPYKQVAVVEHVRQTTGDDGRVFVYLCRGCMGSMLTAHGSPFERLVSEHMAWGPEVLVARERLVELEARVAELEAELADGTVDPALIAKLVSRELVPEVAKIVARATTALSSAARSEITADRNQDARTSKQRARAAKQAAIATETIAAAVGKTPAPEDEMVDFGLVAS